MSKVKRVLTRVETVKSARSTDFLIVFHTIQDNSKQLQYNPYVKRIGRGDFTKNAKDYAKKILGVNFKIDNPLEDIKNSTALLEAELLRMITVNKPQSNKGLSFEKRLYAWMWLKIKEEGGKLPTKNGILTGYFIIGQFGKLHDSFCTAQNIVMGKEEELTKTIVETLGFLVTSGVEDYINKKHNIVGHRLKPDPNRLFLD